LGWIGVLRRRNWLLYYGVVAGAHIVAFSIVGLLTRDWTKFFIYLAGFATVITVIMTVRTLRRRRRKKQNDGE